MRLTVRARACRLGSLEHAVRGATWRLAPWCTYGLRIAASPTLCRGTRGQACDFTCDDGHSAVGMHICGGLNYSAGSSLGFEGGACVPSVCAAPTLATGQRVVRSALRVCPYPRFSSRCSCQL